MFPISAANSSPPLPSNTGVALAELNKKEKGSFESFCSCWFYIKNESKTLLHRQFNQGRALLYAFSKLTNQQKTLVCLC